MWVDKGFCSWAAMGQTEDEEVGLPELWRDNWRQLIVNDQPTSTRKGINQANYGSNRRSILRGKGCVLPLKQIRTPVLIIATACCASVWPLRPL